MLLLSNISIPISDKFFGWFAVNLFDCHVCHGVMQVQSYVTTAVKLTVKYS